MIILFPVPMWFVIAGLIVSVMFVIYEIIDDADAEQERLDRIRNPRPPEQIFPRFKVSEPGSCPEFQHLLKRLAATRKVQA